MSRQAPQAAETAKNSAHVMVTPPAETDSRDLPLRDLPAIETAEDLAGEVILSTEQMAAKEYLDELAFMEEPVIVRLHRGREKFAPAHEQFGVNGKTIWIPVEQNTRVPRKYLEVMARSQPMDVRTQSGEENSDAGAYNRIQRTLSANFTFSVIDDSARGTAWLAKVMRES